MPKFYADDNRGHKVSLKNDRGDVNIIIDGVVVAWIDMNGALTLSKIGRDALDKLGLVEDKDNLGYVKVGRERLY